jgi:hypothetical protein
VEWFLALDPKTLRTLALQYGVPYPNAKMICARLKNMQHELQMHPEGLHIKQAIDSANGVKNGI